MRALMVPQFLAPLGRISSSSHMIQYIIFAVDLIAVSTLPLYSFKNEANQNQNNKGKSLSVPDDDTSIDFLNTLVLGQVH